MLKLHANFNGKLVKLNAMLTKFSNKSFFNFQFFNIKNVTATVLSALEVPPFKFTDTILSTA